MRRRSSCSGCWILPQPEQARLHWNSGSSSTISGNLSRLARRWRIRYQPMRVLCLTRTAMRPTLVAWSQLVKRARHPSQGFGRAQRPSDRLGTHQLVPGAVEHDTYDPERALARGAGEPHRLHVHGDRAAPVQLGAALAERQARDAHDVADAHLQAAPGEAADELAGEPAAHALLGMTFVGCGIDL